MRVTSSADWRSSLPFDTPVLVSELLPGGPARCSGCGYGSDPWPRDKLWAVKGHHPNHHDGDVRFYCAQHVPVFEAPAPGPQAKPARRSLRGSAERAPRRTPAVERPKAICPNCFVEVPSSGVCGMCGQAVASA